MAGGDIEFGSDSFLDVMANMVGILIVLVMVALMRAGEVTQAPAEHDKKAVAEIKSMAQESTNLETEVRRTAREIETLDRATTQRRTERDTLAMAVAERERDLEEERHKLDDKAQAAYDLRVALSNAESELLRIRSALQHVDENAKPTITTQKIETFPTPISRTVTGQEIHFQLRDNRICYVPMEALTKLFEEEVKRQLHRLQDTTEIADSVGPIEGFRMHYTVERIDVPVQVRGGQGTMSKLAYGFHLTPISSDQGELIEAALGNHSEFRAILKDYNPRSTTVTLWTYPDSFAIYRDVKKALYLSGFTVAGRPLPDGTPIGASSSGSKSAAE